VNGTYCNQPDGKADPAEGAHCDVNPISEAFGAVLGLPSWLVRKGHGSFITLELGDPDVSVEQPRLLPTFIDGGPERAMIRGAHVHGAWHLWIYACLWSLTVNAIELAHSESADQTIGRALRILNGQALVSVQVDPDSPRSTFTFDLGCVLTTRPSPAITPDEEPAEQWMLFQPNGRVLTIRSDGRYRHQAGNARPDDQRWMPIPAT
jgi:hypothetical protein